MESEEWRKIFHVNKNEKKAGVTLLISDTIDFNTKTGQRERRYYIMIKRSIQKNK